MKSTGNVPRRSVFWSRLLGLLIAFAIVAVLVFGGVNSLMGELSDVYDALAMSETELAYTRSDLAVVQNELGDTRDALATAHYALEVADDRLEGQSRALQQAGQRIADANAQIQALAQERNDLKRGLSDAVYVISEADRALQARTAALQAAQAQLEQIKQQPKLSVVMTTERQFAMSQRERMAASQVMMYAEGDGGMIYYQSAEALHEREQHVAYSERTQIILTQTGPGDDVLRCLHDGCALVSGGAAERHAHGELRLSVRVPQQRNAVGGWSARQAPLGCSLRAVIALSV